MKMIERFTETISTGVVTDNLTGREYKCEYRIDDALLQVMNELHEENYKIKSILLKRVEELNDAYDKSARAGMPTGAIIGELDSFEEICRIMGWIE